MKLPPKLRLFSSDPLSPSPANDTPQVAKDLVAQIDPHRSWQAESIWTAETYTLPLPAMNPAAIGIRLPKLTTRTSGFLFPDSARWIPPATVQGPAAAKPKRKPESGRKHNRIKPPSDIVKLQDRLYYLLQPPLDLLVGSGQLNFPFEPFPYQLDGMAFLFPRYAGILADEMGLGKTMQAISTIRLLLCSGEVRSVLLVCPKPLVTNWLREFSVWAPEIPITAIEGSSAKREFAWRSPQVPVKVANYELLMRDEALLTEGDLHFDLVVLDEAQRIKNRTSTTSQVVRSIPRTRSWALTGTPVENCPDDLVGIFEFLSPGYLRPGMPMPQIASRAGDYILRRTKDMVLDDMPPKLYRDAELQLTPEQWSTYEAAEKEGVVHLENLEQSLTIQHVFELVLRLKQICNFDPVTGSSCKLERLVADIEEVAASGKKAIVFSQWVKSLDKIKEALQPYGPLEYHGKIPQKKRNTVIDRFKNDPSSHVILMSYGAGSVGLNLQFCEYVFLFDRWWNPAIEDQAINRAHRLGAAGAVTVTKMMALGTIEQRINDVLDQKREMFDALFASGSAEAGARPNVGLSREEIFGLFDLRAPCGKKVA
ncbi:DEAD/DEAH box helicase [Roseiconus nitratireducens]|uniref:DEAD/DEAH box helicase n=1 Tax=Roseiconus nitratireducens TaxID=2605748 RepID=A0A5M6DGG5_9BACT|nr:DEAD/DEAH box helicase [Roseiconus nitratireducens]KAA5545380.1 DEAD/DEAH box helicase [Roseiconus nitratireducens]